MELTDNDLRLAREMRDANVLQDIDPHCVDCKDGLMLVTCSDGDRFYDIYTKKVEVVLSQRRDARIHTFGWNGGALRLAVYGIRFRWLGRILFHIARFVLSFLGVPIIDPIDEIAKARDMKGIDTAGLVGHGPCGWAYASKKDLTKVMRMLIRAKNNLKAAIPGIKVKLYPHIHWPNGKDCSYSSSREGMAAYETHLADRNKDS